MTRKDYLLIAEALRRWNKNCVASYNSDSAVAEVTKFIGDALAADNPRFDRAHFLAVVRGEEELTSKPKPRNLALEIASGLNNQTRRD